ncbi:YdeI/OmpD-associated family protein [Parasediminibacterium sp. JCM 36343]|uniref:YdeI/OmpD-associated family protein n=1 Tax=Parasediminibacterium sp. JCM 36343 TaxID=3374279 RepID=UPI00397D517E
MSNLSLFEKLELKDDKTLLIQGIPSSIEKQFAKLSYAKNVTPLLRTKKIDFALLFAINQNQLNNILKEVFVALHGNSKLWVAYPKQTSKIVSDLNRDCSWDFLSQCGFEGVTLIAIDNVWNALRFTKTACEAEPIAIALPEEPTMTATIVEDKEASAVATTVDFDKNLVVTHVELEKVFNKHKQAKDFFTSLSTTNQNEYVSWIEGAKKEETKQRRLDAVVEKLNAGKKNPSEK